MTILRVMYIALIGYLMYTMIKRGGCCVHGRSDSHIESSCCDENNNHNSSRKVINQDEKVNSIEI